MTNLINRIRWALVRLLVGKTSYINNVTFYQTVCLDIKDEIVIENVTVDLGHTLTWKDKRYSIAFYFDDYKNNLIDKIE